MPISVTALIRSLPADLSKDVEKFKPMLCRLANKVSQATGEREEDILQDFLTKLIIANSKFRHQSRQTTFIVAVVRNMAFSMMRIARRRKPYYSNEPAPDPATRHDHTHREYLAHAAAKYISENWPSGAVEKLISSETDGVELAERYGMPV